MPILSGHNAFEALVGYIVLAHMKHLYCCCVDDSFPTTPAARSCVSTQRRSNGFLRDSYNLPCGHTFCLGCVNDALADSNSCPTCMNPAWQKDILKTALTVREMQFWGPYLQGNHDVYLRSRRL